MIVLIRATIHTRIDRVPRAEPRGQRPPLATLFGHIENGIEHLQILNTDITALHWKRRGNPFVSGSGDFHR